MSRKNWSKESGQGMIEYVILVALIGILAMVATENLGKKVRSKIGEINKAIDERVQIRGRRDEGL
jgi:Flp pilus assembly pilin Flp